MFVDEPGHLEHRDLTASENRAEVFVSVDHAAILGILQTLTLDVTPQFLGYFSAWHRATAYYGGELAARLHRLHECRIWCALPARGFPPALASTALPRRALSAATR